MFPNFLLHTYLGLILIKTLFHMLDCSARVYLMAASNTIIGRHFPLILIILIKIRVNGRPFSPVDNLVQLLVPIIELLQYASNFKLLLPDAVECLDILLLGHARA